MSKLTEKEIAVHNLEISLLEAKCECAKDLIRTTHGYISALDMEKYSIEQLQDYCTILSNAVRELISLNTKVHLARNYISMVRTGVPCSKSMDEVKAKWEEVEKKVD